MPGLYVRPWFSGAGRSVMELDFGHRRAGHFDTSQWSVASSGEKFVPLSISAEQSRCGTENGNIRKLGTPLSEVRNIEEDVSVNCVRWMRGVSGLEVVNADAENDLSVLQEDQLRPGGGKLGDDDRTVEERICNNGERKRYVGRLRRRSAIMGAGCTVLSVNCLCCSKADAGSSGSEWNYGGPSGVGRWPGLCAFGPKQSPIDISLSKAKTGEPLGELHFDYCPGSPTILNPGHGTMQVSFAQGKNILRVGDRNLELLQFHFHAPSEHAFDGNRFAMEAHLVHRDMKNKNLAVVGIMLDANKFGLPNKVLAETLAYAPAEHGKSVHVYDVTFPPSLLLPPVTRNGKRQYVHYAGSLSTPPCSEGVDWFVLETPLQVPTSQVLDFLRFAGDGHSLAFNSRPLQPLGDRVVYKGL